MWESIPHFTFSSNELSCRKHLLQEEEDVSLHDQADQYLYQIEKSLEYLLSNKVHIRRFHLDLFKSNGNHLSRFNNILYLANKNQVDQLLLHGLENSERTILPLSSFVSVNSFRVLELKNCVLNEEILKVDPVFPCLRQMSLFHIKLLRRANHLIETLLRNCPVLEDLFVKECKLKRIHVGDHLNLRKVTILGVPVARIESKSIEFLHFEYKGREAFNLSENSWNPSFQKFGYSPIVVLDKHLITGDHSEWFLRLKTCLPSFEYNILKILSCNSVSFRIWHNRLGHPSFPRMKHFTEINKNIPLSSSFDCEVCHLAKQKRLSFPVSSSTAESTFDLIHLDVWGPFPIKSIYGHSYFLTIVDDKSRYVWIYPMKLKSEVRDLVVQFYTLVETQFSKKVKSVRTDNAREFDMHDFFKLKGIVHQNSCIHTPQQNSIVERKHQHLLAVARALRFQSHLPLQFWIDCVLHAAYLINVTPTPVLSNKTPFEVLFHKQPKLDHLRNFGCLAFASILPKPKTKMHPRATKTVFIGYPKNIKGYRLYDLETKNIFVSRDVVFSEDKFPFQEFKSENVKEIVLPAHAASSSLEDCLPKHSGFKCVHQQSATSESATSESATDDINVSQHDTFQQSVQHQNSNLEDSPILDFVLAGSSNIADSIQQDVSDLPENDISKEQSKRPSRNVRLPQKYKDFHVALPKTCNSPHNIAQVLSYDSFSS
ncbi:hypothetical protein GQ457_18G016730 [Hibiscus cannabinus]